MAGIFTPARAARLRPPNIWDAVALLCVVGALVAVANAARGTLVPLSAPQATEISLDPAYLPGYALRTTLRMFAALAASLAFTFTYAPLAAKSRRAGLVMVPMLDILQSVPILGFLGFTIAFFMNLFPGQVMGLELAAIFAIFTSQAWNMAFSFHQSLSTVPGDLDEATRSFRLTGWQRFWRLEVPYAMPGLVWNTMLSMSGGWFFVVASEAITLGDQSWTLPGVGSYVALALQRQDIVAVGWAVLTMLVVILIYDQLLFRPLVAWSARFRVETTPSAEAPDPWVLALLRRTRVLRLGGEALGRGLATIGGLRLALPPVAPALRRVPPVLGDAVFAVLVFGVVGGALWKITVYVSAALSWTDVALTLGLGAITLLRVMVMIVLASLIWVPVGVWLGLRPAWARRVQPVAQFLAAFPANLLFPPVVLVIVHYGLDADVWLTPLMVLGTQWYILFNVIAGASAFPGDLQEVARHFHIGGWLWWRRVIMPGILPYYLTGAITASGGSWNAAIVAEVASWGDKKLVAHGLGAYIAQATGAGDFHRIVLGVVVMSLFVVGLNRLFWRPLAAHTARRATLS
ncbi:MAG TPA: ABC transporter permease subunit [Acetobacteraceae bacterium]|jgi:NitT/TauT family transport system permease protein|nr:ABC transporter permease subunit [Acetobacteraceae bacterium]